MHELYVFILHFILGLGAGITIGSFFWYYFIYNTRQIRIR